jgi:hypothetical protein
VSYQIQRVFFASPIEMQAELHAFHQVAGRINESLAMPAGVLLAPACLTAQMADKRFFQPVIDSNIREASLCVFVLQDSWGPPERNFESDYRLAQACIADPASPLRSIAVLFDHPASAREAAVSGIDGQEFASLDEFRERSAGILTAFFESLRESPVKAAAAAQGGSADAT